MRWNSKFGLPFILFAFTFSSFGQLNETNINKKLLEHEVKILIDSTRLANKLPALYNDSILYIASEHHANYMVRKGALSHEELDNKKCFSPQNRAEFFGAPKSYFVGENVVYTPYNASVRVKGKTFLTNNYKEIARCLVYSWVNSKGHFKNIIHPDYQVTGLAISIDTVQKRIYACQKFAQVLYTYSFSESTSFFPYAKMEQKEQNKVLANEEMDISYPFKLRFNEKEKCQECKEIWNNYPSMSVRVSSNYFILRVEDAAIVQDLIQGKFDGFAIELVSFDPFACGNPQYENEPSRRNGLKRTSGRILEPVYRDDLMKGFKKRKRVEGLRFADYLLNADSVSFFKRFGRYKLVNFEANYFEIKLGKVPKDMKFWWNHNLMYIHDRQICHFLYLTNYPGELNSKLLDVPYFKPVPVNQYEFQLDTYRDSVELFYEPNETVSLSNDLAALVNKYKENDVTIREIRINGFSSVDGKAAANEILHKKRAENILDQLKSVLHTDTVCRIQSQVAWDHFYVNVKTHPKWKFLYTLSQEEIVKYLADPKNEKPIDILKKERKVKVEIIGQRELTPKNAFYYVNRDINRLFSKDKKGKYICSDPNLLAKIYEKAYYFTTVDTLTVNNFLKIKFPDLYSIFSHNLWHDVAFYRYHLLKDSVDKKELMELEKEVENVFDRCGAAEHLSSEFHYLSACLLVDKIKRKGKSNVPENPDFQKAFDRLNLLLTSYNLDSLFHLSVAKANLNIVNILCETVDPNLLFEYNDIVNSSLIHIVEYYRKTDQLDSPMALSLGKLLTYFQNIPLAVDLCKDFLYDDDILKFYLPLIYYHSSYLTSENGIAFEKHFHDLLLEAKKRLKTEDWCRLFFGKYGIPFQVMDNKIIRNEFCASCPNRVNEVLAE